MRTEPIVRCSNGLDGIFIDSYNGITELYAKLEGHKKDTMGIWIVPNSMVNKVIGYKVIEL